MMKKSIILSFIYLLLCCCDGLLTFINTPDLSQEANPLVSVLDYGWLALFIVNIIAIILFFTCAYFTFCQYKTVFVDAKNRREYLSQLEFERPDKFIWTFYKMPKAWKNWKPILSCCSYVLIYSLLVVRILLVIEWILITFNINVAWYFEFRSLMPWGRVDIILSVICVFFFAFVWINKNYKDNQKMRFN